MSPDAAKVQVCKNVEISGAEILLRGGGHGRRGSAARGAAIAARFLARRAAARLGGRRLGWAGGGLARWPRLQKFSSSIPRAEADARFCSARVARAGV